MIFSGVWTVAEASAGGLEPVSFELLTRGRSLADKLGTDLAAVVIAGGADRGEVRKLIEAGADKVYLVDDPRLKHFICENYSNVLVRLIQRYKPEIILGAATSTGRTLMPHVAAAIGAGLTADCTELDIEEETGCLLQTRPAIGGNIMATIKTAERRPQMATVRPRSTVPADPEPGREGEVVDVEYDPCLYDGRVEWLGFRESESDAAAIQDADVVVAGGRGLRKKDNFDLIREMADHLGGAVGASRDAVDRGWISYPHQVGLSGKTVTPRLYIAIGISGAIQHLAGMKTAEHIVVLNSDPEAPILKVADLGLVGDIFELMPMINERLAEEVGRE